MNSGIRAAILLMAMIGFGYLAYVCWTLTGWFWGMAFPAIMATLGALQCFLWLTRGVQWVAPKEDNDANGQTQHQG